MPDTRVLLQSGLVRVNHVRRGGLNVRSKGFFFKRNRCLAPSSGQNCTCKQCELSGLQSKLQSNIHTVLKNQISFLEKNNNKRYNVSCNIRLSLRFCLFVFVEMYFVVILSVFCYFHVFTQCSIKYFLVVTISCFFCN